MKNICIEKATEKDIERINELYVLITGQKSDPLEMKKTLKTFIHNKDYYLLVIKKEGYVIGTGVGIVFRSLANNCSPYFVIDNVAIDSDYQHQGYGTMLFDELHKIAKKRNCCLSYLIAEADNKNAISFYTKLKYTDSVVGFQKQINSDN